MKSHNVVSPIQNNTVLAGQLENAITLNMTHMTRIAKINPLSKVPSMIRTAKKNYSDHLENVLHDRTKSDGQKAIVAEKSAQNLLQAVLREVDKERGEVFEYQTGLEKQVSEALKIRNATDIMIRQNMMMVLNDMPFTEVASLLKSGDVDTAKALELPVMKYKFKLNSDLKRAQRVSELQAEALLGREKAAELVQAREYVNVLEDMGQGLMHQHEQSVFRQSELTKTETVELQDIATG